MRQQLQNEKKNQILKESKKCINAPWSTISYMEWPRGFGSVPE